MRVYLTASEEVEKKLKSKTASDGIIFCLKDTADYALVEVGYPFVEGLVNITFEALDYMDAYELIKSSLERNESDSLEDSHSPDTITGFAKDRYGVIPIEDIHYIEAFGNDVHCMSVMGDFQLKKPLYHYENILGGKGLIRINKSQIVNMRNVKEIIPWFNGRLVLQLSDNLQLEVSKTYAKNLRTLLDL